MKNLTFSSVVVVGLCVMFYVAYHTMPGWKPNNNIATYKHHRMMCKNGEIVLNPFLTEYDKMSKMHGVNIYREQDEVYFSPRQYRPFTAAYYIDKDGVNIPLTAEMVDKLDGPFFRFQLGLGLKSHIIDGMKLEYSYENIKC